MKLNYLYILFLLFLFFTDPLSGLQGPDRRTGYVPHSQRINELTEELGKTRGSNRNAVLLSLAEKHYEQAELYYLIAHAAAAIGELYFSIMEENDIDAGGASGLYRGIGLFELGRFRESEKEFDKFLRHGERSSNDIRIAGRAWLGAAQYAAGNIDGAVQTWSISGGRDRETCSALAYVWGYSGYNIEKLEAMCPINRMNGNSEVIHFIRVMLATGRYESVPELLSRYRFTPSHTEFTGSEREVRYFDPSEIRTLSHAHYALAAHYAGQSNNNRYSRYYRGVYNFRSGHYDRVVDDLTGIDELRSAVYLAAAYYLTGREDIAREVFDYLERSGGEEVLDKLFIQYVLLGIDEKAEKAVAHFNKRTEHTHQRSRRDVSQDIYKNMGSIYFYNMDYERALESLGTAFRTERRADLRANDPGFVVLYASSIVLAKNFIALSDAIDMFSTVTRAYPPAVALVELTALIDVVTNVGREGRVIYRR